jgi:hypothetical protein
LLLVMVVQAAVSLRVRPHPRWGDALLVFGYAQKFPDVPLDHHSLRIGTIIPTRALIEVLGPGEVAVYAWPFAMTLLLTGAVFTVATQLFGRAAGLLAAAFVVFNPVLVFTFRNSTTWQLLPDVPSAALFTLGVALVIGGARADRAGRSRRAALLLATAGLCFGWAYLVREFVAAMFLVLPPLLWGLRLPLRRWLVVAVPMLACLALELVTSWWVHGNPLARLLVASEHHGAPPEPVSRRVAALRFAEALETGPRDKVILAMVVVLVVTALVTRRRGLLFCLGWALSLWVPLTVASGFFDPGQISLPAWKVRYWVPMLPPLLIGCAGAAAVVGWWVHRRLGRVAGGGVAALVVLATLFYAWPALQQVRSYHDPWDYDEVRAYLARHDAQVGRVLSDWRGVQELAVYQYPPVGSRPAWHAHLTALSPVLPPPADTVPADTYYLWTEVGAPEPPSRASGWRLVVGSEALKLYAPPAAAR